MYCSSYLNRLSALFPLLSTLIGFMFSSMEIQRSVIKDKLIKSCKVWNIPYYYDFDRWERNILKNKIQQT